MPRPKVDIQPIILSHATELFQQRGYEGVTMRMLATSCHTSPANLYKYYTSKDQLFQAVLSPLIKAIDRLKQEHNEDIQVSPEAFQEGQTAMANIILSFIQKHSKELYLVLFCAKGSAYEDYLDRHVEGRMQMGREYLRLLKQKYPRANIQISDALLYSTCHETINLLKYMVMKKAPPPEQRKIAEEYIAYSTAGLKAIIFAREEARQ